MAPVSAAERAALDGFFRGKRGARTLVASSVTALVTYFADKRSGTHVLNPSTVYFEVVQRPDRAREPSNMFPSFL